MEWAFVTTKNTSKDETTDHFAGAPFNFKPNKKIFLFSLFLCGSKEMSENRKLELMQQDGRKTQFPFEHSTYLGHAKEREKLSLRLTVTVHLEKSFLSCAVPIAY